MKFIKHLLFLTIAVTNPLTATRIKYKKSALKALRQENNRFKQLAKIYKHNTSSRTLFKDYIKNHQAIISLTKRMFDLEQQNNQELLDTVRLQLLAKKEDNQKILLKIFKDYYFSF